jgi:branched-chain amino acid transport system permease protein
MSASAETAIAGAVRTRFESGRSTRVWEWAFRACLFSSIIACLLVLVVLLVLALVLALFFSRTHLGLAILGLSQEPVATELMGISVRRLSAVTWGAAAVLGGLGGILSAPLVGGFGPGFLTSTALIPAFTAAVLGGMTSLPGAFVGGVVVGVTQSAAVSFPTIATAIPGAQNVAVFALLLLVLTVRPQGLLGKAS